MTKHMLIDATHLEETRVAVVDGKKLEEFDFETASKRQLKGNIYLAKVVRVEPSLQAAFVEYGGNRHGFLAFNEIHPDYYRIPVADREALLAEDAAFSASEEDALNAVAGAEDAAAPAATESGDGAAAGDPPAGNGAPAEADGVGGGSPPPSGDAAGEAPAEPTATVETIGGDEVEDARRRRARPARRYKIQEVIKRRQILLIQVTKEERGTKGAAITTYLSLAGRYCVLMPNTARGGGVSRKITSVGDRKRLKGIVEEMDIPDGMAVIVRTAGSERSKAEVRRDFEYLLRLWNEIRELTLQSSAPALIYEEANLIKRSIRDLYGRDIEDITVEGEDGYKAAKAFMRTLMPSHAKRVQLYKDSAVPLFQRHQIESQIDAIHNPVVQLPAGGYIVLDSTEALVAIDVNSGRATRERNIEETALRTNLEAADEVARQLRLRDLAGLIVIDFIDMEESRHNAQVERRLKEAMRHDRARIQLGRISPFGLLELSRQRLRPSLFEASMQACRHCHGTGHIRSTESTALHVLRAIEEEDVRNRSAGITVTVPTAVALYILNQKRTRLVEIELRHGMRVFLASDDSLIPPEFRLERHKTLAPGEEVRIPVRQISAPSADETAGADADAEAETDAEAEANAEAEVAAAAPSSVATAEEKPAGRRRVRRRRRRGDEERPATGAAIRTAAEAPERVGEPTADVAAGEAGAAPAPGGTSEEPRRRRRRGKRGGRRRARDGERMDEAAAPASENTDASASDMTMAETPRAAAAESARAADEDAIAAAAETGSAEEREPTRRHRVRRPRPAPAAAETGPEPALAAAADRERPPSEPRHREPAEGAAPARRGGNGAVRGDVAPQPAETSNISAGGETRRGWWRRLVE